MEREVMMSYDMNYDVIAKWRPFWIRQLGFLDFPTTLGKDRNSMKTE